MSIDLPLHYCHLHPWAVLPCYWCSFWYGDDKAMATQWLNIGAPIAPVTSPECCECDHGAFRARVAENGGM